MRSDIDPQGAMDALNHFQQQAIEMVLGDEARAAFDLSAEPEASRDRYGKHLRFVAGLVLLEPRPVAIGFPLAEEVEQLRPKAGKFLRFHRSYR